MPVILTTQKIKFERKKKKKHPGDIAFLDTVKNVVCNADIWKNTKTLCEMTVYTLFFKNVYSRLRTVNADIQTPHLPVNIIRLL